MKTKLLLFLTCFVLAKNYAYAQWTEVSTDHFVIYAEQNENKIVEFATRLERYHSAMNWLFSRLDVKPGPSNRLTIYVLATRGQVVDLHGGNNRNVAGFYIPRAGSSIAVISSIKKGAKGVSESEQILLHEYAHHFLIGSSSSSYPLWVQEGAAEFFSSARFESDGGVGLGYPAYHRKYELESLEKTAIETLLDTKFYLANRSNKGDSYYAQSWLLFHFLQFSKERQGQLNNYLQLIEEGKGEIEAANLAFGDLAKLDRELDAYKKQSVMKYVPIPASRLAVGSVVARTLTEAESEAMPSRILLKRGASEEQLGNLLPKVRKLYEMHPGNLGLMIIAAEAEFYSNNFNEVITITDKIITIDGSHVEAHTLKGLAMAQVEINKNGSNADWEKVRSQFEIAIALDGKNPVPHHNYYLSYLNQETVPPMKAVSSLENALRMAPFDRNLRLAVANHYMYTQQYHASIVTLKPLTTVAHDPELGKLASEMTNDAQLKIDAQTNAPTEL